MNVDVFSSHKSAITAAISCEQVAIRALDAQNAVAEQIAAVTARIAAIAPLITPPTDLSSVISWIGAFIAPMAAEHTTLIAQLATLQTQSAEITEAVESRQETLGCS